MARDVVERRLWASRPASGRSRRASWSGARRRLSPEPSRPSTAATSRRGGDGTRLRPRTRGGFAPCIASRWGPEWSRNADTRGGGQAAASRRRIVRTCDDRNRMGHVLGRTEGVDRCVVARFTVDGYCPRVNRDDPSRGGGATWGPFPRRHDACVARNVDRVETMPLEYFVCPDRENASCVQIAVHRGPFVSIVSSRSTILAALFIFAIGAIVPFRPAPRSRSSGHSPAWAGARSTGRSRFTAFARELTLPGLAASRPGGPAPSKADRGAPSGIASSCRVDSPRGRRLADRPSPPSSLHLRC